MHKVISDSGALAQEVLPLWVHNQSRGVSSLINCLCIWSVTRVLEITTWMTYSVFASFYLKEVQYVYSMRVADL